MLSEITNTHKQRQQDAWRKWPQHHCSDKVTAANIKLYKASSFAPLYCLVQPVAPISTEQNASKTLTHVVKMRMDTVVPNLSQAAQIENDNHMQH